MPKHYNFRNKVNFIRRPGNRSSQAKETPHRCESGNSQDGCRMTASSRCLKFQPHDKGWWGHPGQIMEGLWLLLWAAGCRRQSSGREESLGRGGGRDAREREAATDKATGRAPRERSTHMNAVRQPGGYHLQGAASWGQTPRRCWPRGQRQQHGTPPPPPLHPGSLQRAWHRAQLKVHSLLQA